MVEFSIAGRPIGGDNPPYIIAEISGNHGGSLERALALIDMASDCGADAVKFQSYTPDTITLDCDTDDFIVGTALWEGQTLHQLYRYAHTPFEWHPAMFDRARQRGITAFSSPFDDSAVALLESLQAPAYKIASCELVDVNLIRRAASTGKPLILSTGMASDEEIAEAVTAARQMGNEQLCLLHCVSGYPTPLEQSHLARIKHLKRRFALPVGLSDHSLGTQVPVAAVALGACVIEKHICLSRELDTVDSAFSLEPQELRTLVADCRAIAEALTPAPLQPAESDSRRFRRSLYAVKDIRAGEAFSADNVRSIRPGAGLHPRYLHQLLGKQSRRTIQRGTPLSDDDLG